MSRHCLYFLCTSIVLSVLEFDKVGATGNSTSSPCRRIPSDLRFGIYPVVVPLYRLVAAAMLNKLARSLQSVCLLKCVSCVVRFFKFKNVLYCWTVGRPLIAVQLYCCAVCLFCCSATTLYPTSGMSPCPGCVAV